MKFKPADIGLEITHLPGYNLATLNKEINIKASAKANARLKSALLEERVDLELEWKAEPDKNRNHIASRIGGEIDFIDKWLEELEEQP